MRTYQLSRPEPLGRPGMPNFSHTPRELSQPSGEPSSSTSTCWLLIVWSVSVWHLGDPYGATCVMASSWRMAAVPTPPRRYACRRKKVEIMSTVLSGRASSGSESGPPTSGTLWKEMWPIRRGPSSASASASVSVSVSVSVPAGRWIQNMDFCPRSDIARHFSRSAGSLFHPQSTRCRSSSWNSSALCRLMGSSTTFGRALTSFWAVILCAPLFFWASQMLIVTRAARCTGGLVCVSGS